MNSALFSVYCFAVWCFTLSYAVHSHATGLDTTAQKQMKYGSNGKCSEEYKCENGGKCIDSFCKCKNGTSGGFCSIIDACEKEPKPCGSEECRYNVTEEKEYCHPSRWFHPEEKRRYDYCAEDEDKCENGGICYKKDGKPLCFCKEGTLGEECRTIQKCLTEFCGLHDEGVTCKFSVEKEQAFCECHDSLKGFHKLDKMCKIKCDESIQCKNGGKCTGDPDSFCECKTGTSGDLCSTIDACAEVPDICGFEAKCRYDADKEDVFCECEDDSEWFDEKDKACKRGCDEEEHACEHGGYCVKSFVPICECRKGTSGNLCSIIDACRPEGELCGTVKCSYNVYKEEVFCDCEDDSKWFDATDKTCKDCSCSDNEECYQDDDGKMKCVCKEGFGRAGDKCIQKCNDEYRCQNGGECIGDPDSFCTCKAGTSGDLCGTIDACKKDPHLCNIGICSYNVTEEKEYCDCQNPSEWFHPIDKTCHEICEKEYNICENGGSCYYTRGGPTCFCKNGTSGYQCKTIEVCLEEDFCGSNDDVSCMFDAEKEQPFCKCEDSSKRFHKLDNVCRKPCTVDSECLFGGQCLDMGDGKFCNCTTGTHGDTCQIIDDCDSGALQCGPDAFCAWDHIKKEAYCICLRGFTFNTTTGTCQRKCNEEYQCENGGECIGDSDTSCKCKPGTSGDLCSIVDACEQNPSLCGTAICGYNVTEEKEYCYCENSSEWFHPKEKSCYEICKSEDFDVCKNGAFCYLWYGYFTCICQEGTTGYYCETIEACLDKDFCGSNDDVSCEYNTEKEEPFCKCENRWKKFHKLDKVCKTTCSNDTDCRFGGQCIDVEDEKFCNCTRGTYGDVCRFIDDCDSGALKCGPDAFCTWDLQKKEAYCECFGGLLFNTTTGRCKNPCQERNCSGHGVCEWDPKYKETSCLCKDGWNGLDCDINPCQGRNCSGHGVCEWDSDHRKTKCLCRDGWKGSECNIHPCQGRNCSGHGICMWNPDYRETRCICRDGWTGSECSIHPCKDKDCNRNGICIWDFDRKQAICMCKNGWIGEQCEIRPQEKVFENFKITIAVAVTCAILFFILLLVFIRRIRELEKKVIEAKM